MAIVQITTDFAGQIADFPRRVKMVTTDDNTTITTAGYLNPKNLMGFAIYPTDIFDVTYSYNVATHVGTYDQYVCSISNGVITLIPDVAAGIVTLPVVDGDFSVFDGTSGKMKDAGYSPSDPAATKVAMVGSDTTIQHIAYFVDTDGTIDDAANGGIFNRGNIIAGVGTDGVEGYFESFPPTANNGGFIFQAVDNANDVASVLHNSAVGQTTAYVFPDPVNVDARVLVGAGATPFVSGNLLKASGTGGVVADAGARIVANTTAAYGGGTTNNVYAATGLTVAAKGSAVIRASTNSVSITKALPGTDTLDITFSADPGAGTTVDYIYVTAAQA